MACRYAMHTRPDLTHTCPQPAVARLSVLYSSPISNSTTLPPMFIAVLFAFVLWLVVLFGVVFFCWLCVVWFACVVCVRLCLFCVGAWSFRFPYVGVSLCQVLQFFSFPESSFMCSIVFPSIHISTRRCLPHDTYMTKIGYAAFHAAIKR